METVKASVLIRAKSIYQRSNEKSTYHAIAVRGSYVWALSEQLNGLDQMIGPDTTVIDEPDGAVFTSFDDTHTHLIFAGLAQQEVPVHKAKDIPEILELLRIRAAETPKGEWIATTTNWQEYNLTEKRFPTIQELDDVSTEHPIYVRRGGHNLAANSLALQLAGITKEGPAPPGGLVVRDGEGNLTGLLREKSVFQLVAARPQPSLAEREAGLESASAEYAATGIGCVRDCFVTLDDLAVLKSVYENGRLHVRVRALIAAVGLRTPAEVEKLLDGLEPYAALRHDPYLSIWGLKFMIDGGIEAGATEEPYLRGPHDDISQNAPCDCVPTDWRGAILVPPAQLIEVMDVVVRRGYRIGTHAYGDRGISTLLDIYEQLLKRHPHLPPGTLVMEHGGIATPDQRKRAVSLGIPVTIQQPLLHDVAAVQAVYWGEERTSRLFPARGWLDEGAVVTGGSDFPVGKFGVMRSVWGMASRMTVAGIKGPEHAITVKEAVAMHSTMAAQFLKEDAVRGTIAPGRWADMSVWPIDPLELGDDKGHLETLRDLMSTYTIVDGKLRGRR